MSMKPYPWPPRDVATMTDEEVKADLADVEARMKESQGSDDEGCGGSPGEWMLERAEELQATLDKRMRASIAARRTAEDVDADIVKALGVPEAFLRRDSSVVEREEAIRKQLAANTVRDLREEEQRLAHIRQLIVDHLRENFVGTVINVELTTDAVAHVLSKEMPRPPVDMTGVKVECGFEGGDCVVITVPATFFGHMNQNRDVIPVPTAEEIKTLFGPSILDGAHREWTHQDKEPLVARVRDGQRSDSPAQAAVTQAIIEEIKKDKEK